MSQSSNPQKGLGAFLGVFTPTILTILGVIMYLRFGWLVGHAGIWQSLVIVILANCITMITSFSLSAIATNGKVGVGGAYYMISRSLGLEIGGAIGLPLFLSQALSVTLYAFGLAESLRFIWPEAPLPIIAVAVIVVVALLSYGGADKALKSQVPVMILIGISLLALIIGVLSKGTVVHRANWGSGQFGFWPLFAVFFPAVTGIMAGLGLSGDLANPQKAIPKGTLIACLVGFIIYLLVPVLLYLGTDAESLKEDPLIWTKIAPLGFLFIMPGLWGAIFSSAVGSMLGAPRTLQALAMDRIVPKRFASNREKGKEPVIGSFITLIIAIGAVFLGNLNTVATVVTMFFLTIYCTINLVVAAEHLSGDPSWRPSIRTPWYISLIGAIGCFGAMLLINAWASITAVTIEIIIFALLQRRERQADWGDVRRGVYEAILRWTLLKLARRPMSARNWRPHILVFVEKVEQNFALLRFGDWFSQHRGIVMVCELVEGDLLELRPLMMERESAVQKFLQNQNIEAFAEVDVVSQISRGIVSVSQANGMAGLECNTILLGWPKTPEKLSGLLSVIRKLESLNKSLVIGHVADGETFEKAQKIIHIWWGGLQRNGDLLLLLSYLLTRNRKWMGAEIHVMSIASNDLMKTQTETALEKIMPELRINAEIKAFVKPDNVSVNDLISEKSAEADIVMLGLATPEPDKELEYAHKLFNLVSRLKTFFLVKNASLFVGELIAPQHRNE